MSLLVSLALITLFILPFILFRHMVKRENDLLVPVYLIAGMHLCAIVPYLLIISFWPKMVDSRLQETVGDLGPTVLWFGILQALGFIAMLFGAISPWGVAMARRLPVGKLPRTNLQYTLIAIGATIIGFVSWQSLVEHIGGMDFLLMNLNRRAELLSGNGYFLFAVSLLVVGIAGLVYSLRYKISPLKVLLIVGLIIAAFLMYASFGGRASGIRMLIVMVFVWHYGVRRITRIPWIPICVLALVLVPYFVVMPIIRNSRHGLMDYLGDVNQLIGDARDNIPDAVKQTSYVGHYLFIVHEFGPENCWYGRSYLDLLTAPIPSSIYPQKPPVDDGVYVNTMFQSGYHLVPPMPASQLNPSSLPPETFGIAYMNFWLPGVILASFLQGLIYRIFYRYMHTSNYSLLSILLYANILLYFGFSNLRLVQSITNLAFITLYLVVTSFLVTLIWRKKARPVAIPPGPQLTRLPKFPMEL